MPVDEPSAPDAATPAAPGSRPGAISGLAGPSGLFLGMLWAAVVGLDQAAKALVRSALALHDSVVVIPGFLDFTHVRNTGAAFGLLNAVDLPFKPVILTGIALTALAAIGLFAARTASRDWPSRIGLAFVIGGAVGNLIDRITMGFVLDFIDVYWRGWHFWVFNVADAAITVGAALLILDMLVVHRHVSETV